MEERKEKQRVERRSQIGITEVAKAEYARLCTVSIGQKNITIPCYIPKIRKSFEVDLVCDEKKISPRFQGLAFDIMDVQSIMREIGYNGERQPKQQQLFVKLDYGSMRELLPILIDPCTEYFYFKNDEKRKKLGNLQGIPAFVQDTLRKTTWENHASSWNKIILTDKVDMLISWNARYQSKFHADIVIPPVPLISDEKSSLLDIAMEVNRKSAFATADVYGKEPAFYFLLNYVALRDMNQLNRIVEFVYDMEEEFQQVKAIFLKIRNFNITDEDGRRNLGDFLRGLSSAKRFNNRAVFLLDADALAIPSICNGVDGFSEPLDGRIRDYGFKEGRRSSSQYGMYYHPERLKFIKWDRLKRIYSKNGRVLPCSCPICSYINQTQPKGIASSSRKWNRQRREHLFCCRVTEIDEIVDSISERGDTRPMSDKISRSAVKDYLDIINNPIQ